MTPWPAVAGAAGAAGAALAGGLALIGLETDEERFRLYLGLAAGAVSFGAMMQAGVRWSRNHGHQGQRWFAGLTALAALAGIASGAAAYHMVGDTEPGQVCRVAADRQDLAAWQAQVSLGPMFFSTSAATAPQARTANASSLDVLFGWDGGPSTWDATLEQRVDGTWQALGQAIVERDLVHTFNLEGAGSGPLRIEVSGNPGLFEVDVDVEATAWTRVSTTSCS